ncbi:MAG TPA: hypothetical protein VNI01_00200 [Elusimicrobiota bacterium]|nr:hypothetical protein [Elusimicrobiota bacterium]
MRLAALSLLLLAPAAARAGDAGAVAKSTAPSTGAAPATGAVAQSTAAVVASTAPARPPQAAPPAAAPPQAVAPAAPEAAKKNPRGGPLDAPPPGAFLAARGWDRVEFSNDSSEPVVLRVYSHLPNGKWRQVRFARDRTPRPRFFSRNSPPGEMEFPLSAGDRVGWLRVSRADEAFEVVDRAGEDISDHFRFRADRPVVSITTPDSYKPAPSSSSTRREPAPAGGEPAPGAELPPGPEAPARD